MYNLYAIRARINPLILFSLPALFLIGIYAINLDAFRPWLLSTVVIGAVGTLMSQIGRGQGKKKEKELWSEWGGCPSIQLLRWRDASLPLGSKIRFHQLLQLRCPVGHPPDAAFEQANRQASDDVYETWSNYLRGQTRDTKKFDLLFRENMNYGFCRNLWGLKPAAIWFIVLLFVGNYLYHVNLHQNFDPRVFASEFWYAAIELIVCLLPWVFLVNKAFVRRPAFAYASRLCEAVEQLP